MGHHKAVADMTGLEYLSSPCLDLLRSGYHPSSAESSDINGFILEKEGELASVSARTVQSQGRLGQLTEKQAQLEQSIANHSSLLAPIRRLSPELLSEIFLHCLVYTYDSIAPSCSGFVEPSTSKAPLLLLRVSVRWRDVALKSPRLWANMGIEDNTAPQWWNTWLSRSGICPLELHISDDLLLSLFSTQPTGSLDISPYQRLRHLHIEVYDPHGPIFPVDSVDMPLLESFSLHLSDSEDGPTSGAIPLMSAPRLRYCSIHNWLGLSQRTPFPWSQLTHLYMEDQPDMLDILRSCNNLVVLDMHMGSLYSGDLPTSSRPVLLAHLTRLQTWFVDPPIPEFTCLNLPSLRDLDIIINSRQHLMSLLQLSGRQIETLRVIGARMLSPEDIEECLALVPHLTQLTIDHDDCLRILSRFVAVQEHGLVPRLKSVRIEACLQDVDDLMDFIKARWKCVQPAGSASVREIYAEPPSRYSYVTSPEKLSFLRRCLDEGLILRTPEDEEWRIRSEEGERGRKSLKWTYPDI